MWNWPPTHLALTEDCLRKQTARVSVQAEHLGQFVPKFIAQLKPTVYWTLITEINISLRFW